jgi:hypothetical protein
MATVYLGISPFFYSGAEGHYERLHSALFESIRSLKGDESSIHLYLGAAGLPQSVGSIALIDPEFKRPDGRISFNKLNRLATDLLLISNSKSTYVHIYEGSISFLLAFKLLARKTSSFNVIINLHQVELFSDLLEYRFIRSVYRFILWRGAKSLKKLTMTSESEISARVLGEKLKFHLDAFPIFSTFNRHEALLPLERTNLVLFSGEFDENRMIADLEGLNIPGQETTILDSRFSNMASLKFLNYLELNSFKVVGDRLSENEYEKIFRTSRKVWFLYRAEINTLGSSGRLMDALNFGLQVYVPAKSALADFASVSRNDFYLVDMNELVITMGSKFSSSVDLTRDLQVRDANYAAYRILEMWEQNSNRKLSDSVISRHPRIFRNKNESLISVYLQWLLLQVALFEVRVSKKIGRLISKFK